MTGTPTPAPLKLTGAMKEAVNGGHGRVNNDEGVRRIVFENSHPAEQARDKDRKGVAIIIDLDSVDGLIDGGLVQLRRA